MAYESQKLEESFLLMQSFRCSQIKLMKWSYGLTNSEWKRKRIEDTYEDPSSYEKFSVGLEKYSRFVVEKVI